MSWPQTIVRFCHFFEALDVTISDLGQCSVGALTTRIGLWGILYYTSNKDPKGPYISLFGGR